MEPRQILRSGITASAIVHLSCLVLLIFFTEVHPFGSVTAEPIAVDIVSPDEVVENPPDPQAAPKEKEKPSDSFDFLSSKPDGSTKAAKPSSPPPSTASPPATPAPAAAAPTKPPQAATPQKQAALTPPKPAPTASPNVASSAAGPAPDSTQQPAQAPALQQQTPSAAPPPVPPPVYTPAQPDLSIKYHVLLGLPQAIPGDGFDAPASEKADVGTDSIAAFRHHLKTCSTLPKSIAPSDKIAIKLRVAMTPEGRLAAEPMLIEASASMKGPLLMQSAISALQACQPYTMLPADRYREWKSLDLGFTPLDFAGAS